jgi:hypothetical protein
MKITVSNYAANKPDRASLTDAEQAGYDLIDMGGLDLYGQDADITDAIDLYLVELNAKAGPAPAPKPAAEPLHPFIFFYGNKKVELYAKSLYDAKQQAIAHFKVKKSKEHEVHGALAVEDEPAAVKEFFKEHGPAIDYANEQSRKAAGKKPAKKHLTVAQRKAAGKPRAQRATAPFRLASNSNRPEGMTLECEYTDVDECVVRANCNGEVLYFYLGDAANAEPNADGYYPSEVVAVAAEGDDLTNPASVGMSKLATKRAKLYGAQILAFSEKAMRTKEKNDKLTKGRAEHNRTTNANKKAAQAVSARNTTSRPTAADVVKNSPNVHIVRPAAKAAPAPAPTPAPEPAPAPKAKATRTKEKKAPAPKAKKEKPVDTRTPVAHFDNDVLFMRDFLRLEGKSATIEDVQRLHRRLEKRIVQEHVRKSSPYADDVTEIATLVAKTFTKMREASIKRTDKLTYNNPVVSRVRAHVEQLRVDAAMNLLGRFINMQGSVPAEKAVKSLETALHNYLVEHPKGDHSLAIGAAHAVLKSWQPGRYVEITRQQLGRLQGLGCPDTPSKPCGCTKKPKGVSGLGSVPAKDADPYGPYFGPSDDAPAVAGPLDEWGQPQEPQGPQKPKANGIFSAIGEKDLSRPAGQTLPLPGPLGQFIGKIERMEYAFALRGDKGAGKSRLQYQILNLFASIGLNCALFSLEINKNSDVVARYTEKYIAPRNRPRVQIASEAPGGLAAIRSAAKEFDVVAIDSWGKIDGVQPGDFDKIRKEFPLTLFIVIFQSTGAGTARGGITSEYDASAVCQVNAPGIAVFEKNRYATGAADELQWDVNKQELLGA